MPKNQAVLAAIENTNILRLKDPTARSAALDALLHVDSDDNVGYFSNFRLAVIDHLDFWGITISAPNVTDDNFLSSQDTTHSFLKIQQAAMAQRVKFKLDLTDKEVLLNILQHNSEECRDYLNTLLTSPPAGGEQPVETHLSNENLTEHGIEEIKRFAAAHIALIALDNAPVALLGQIEASSKDFSVEENKTKFLELIKKLDASLVNPRLIDLTLLWPVIKEKVTEQKNKLIADEVAVLDAKLRVTELKDILKLKAIDEAKDFKSKLNDLIPGSRDSSLYFSSANREQLRQTSRLRRFELQLQRVSNLGDIAHPVLRNIFTHLSIGDQRHFMSHYTAQSGSDSFLTPNYLLRRVVNSTDAPFIKGHLLRSVNEALIKALVEENKKNVLLNSIHNAELAKILATISPAIPLDDVKINLVNIAFRDHVDKAFDAESYIRLVKIIGESENIYKAFGLNNQGNEITDHTMQEEINRQHTYNFDLYKSSNTPSLLNFLLAIRKNVLVNEADIEGIEKTFQGSFDFKKFFEKAVDVSSVTSEMALNEALLNQISPDLFYTIKKDIRAKVFADNNSGEIEEVLNYFKDDLKTIQRNNQDFALFSKKVAFISKVEEIHVLNPLFQSKAPEMKKKYKELAEQCDVIIDELRHADSMLKSHIESISSTGHRKSLKMEKLYEELNEEMQNTAIQLLSYKKVQEKISGSRGILKMIDAIKEGRSYVYEPIGIATGIINKESLAKQAFTSITAASLPSSGGGHFFLKETPPSGSVRYFDVTHHHKPSNIETQGRFIYEPSYENNKPKPGRFEIHQFPKEIGTVDAANKGKLEDALNEARVNFSMTMATQVLATMDGPPTKSKPLRLRGVNEEELKYLWTALIILGEKSSKMRFSSDAVQVHSTAFDPATEKGWFGLNKTSLYHTVFKTYAPLQDSVAATIAHVNERFEAQEVKKSLNAVTNATDFFKQKLSETKKHIDARKEQEGPSPIPPASS